MTGSSILLLLVTGNPLGTQQLEIIHEAAGIFL